MGGWLAGWMVVLAAAGYFRHAHQTSRGGYIIILIIITYTTLNQWGLEMLWKKFPLLFETGNGNSEAEPTKSNGRYEQSERNKDSGLPCQWKYIYLLSGGREVGLLMMTMSSRGRQARVACIVAMA